jgi:hypothetical protein
LRDPDAGRSLTIHLDLDRAVLGLADPADPVDLGLVDRVDPVVLGLVDRVDPVVLGLVDLAGRGVTGLVDPAHRAALVVLGLVDLGDRAVLGLADPVDLGLVDLADPVVLGLVDLAGRGVTGLVDRVHLAGLGDLVDLGLVGPADLVDQGVTGLGDLVDLGLVDLVDQGVTGLVDLGGLVVLVVLVGRAGLGLMGPVDLAGRVERRTHPGAHTIGVTRKWAAPLTRRTALAFPTMARRLRPGSTGSAGMTDALPEGLHVTGTGRRLRVAGTVLRLPVVGTLHGMGRRATWVGRRPISGRSTTAATTPYRCSTRFSVDGASGSSAHGFRCTDITSTLAASGSRFDKPGGGEVVSCRSQPA